MDSCDRYRQALSARLDGEDPGLPVAVIGAHLAQCPECRSWAAAADALADEVTVGDVPPPRPTVIASILNQAAVPDGRSLALGVWRIALLATAMAQLVTVWPGLIAGDLASEHAGHELASWDLGLAVGFLLLAWLPWRAWGALPVVAVMVALLGATSVRDLVAGEATLGHEVVHVFQLAGLACLWQIARRLPRSSVVIQLT